MKKLTSSEILKLLLKNWEDLNKTERLSIVDWFYGQSTIIKKVFKTK
jgi:hypothetical protein